VTPSLRLLKAIGTDRYLSLDEIPDADVTSRRSAHAWQVYQREFGAYCGARVDPQFSRLDARVRPATMLLPPDASVVVVGTGPSLDRQAADLARARRHLILFTSIRGADALARSGITPDLIIVQHHTPLDAELTLSHMRDRGSRAIVSRCPHVAIDRRTPAAMIAGLPPERVFRPRQWASWGLWPATAVAAALAAGAARVALLGVDLGTADRPDRSYEPLAALLDLLAQASASDCIDCSSGVMSARGWRRAAITDAASRPLRSRLRVLHGPGCDARMIARRNLETLEGTVCRARELLALALDARRGCARSPRALVDAASELLSWRETAALRVHLQETLGLSFLPRLWRTGIDPDLGHRLWRPIVLALHELTLQADALSSRVATRAAA